jgi:hypothetical protein
MINDSRFSTVSPLTSEKKARTTPRRAAQRDITVIHLDTDDEEDVDIDGLLEVEKAKLSANENEAKKNPIEPSHGDVDGPDYSRVERDENDFMPSCEEVSVSDQDEDEENNHVGESFDYPDTKNLSSIDKEAGLGNQDSNEDGNPLDSSNEDVDSSRDPEPKSEETSLGEGDDQLVRNTDVTREDGDTQTDSNVDSNTMYSSRMEVDAHGDSKLDSDNMFDISTNNEEEDPVMMEENVVFASVEPSRRVALLHSVVSHSFMQNPVIPVRRSVRRRFVKDMRKAAASAGMPDAGIDTFIVYVRRLFMETIVGVPADTTGDVRNLKFGDEIDDEHNYRKRNLSYPEHAVSNKRRKSKESRTNSIEESILSRRSTPQPVPDTQIDTKRRNELTLQVPVQINGHGSICKDNAVVTVPQTPDYALCEEYHAQGFENVQNQSQQDGKLPNHLDEAESVDINPSKIHNTQPTDVFMALGDKRRGNKASRIFVEPSSLSRGIVEDSQSSEPELPPILERATRPMKIHRQTEPPKQPNKGTESGDTAEQSAGDELVMDLTHKTRSPKPKAPSNIPETQVPAMSNARGPGNGICQSAKVQKSKSELNAVKHMPIGLTPDKPSPEPAGASKIFEEQLPAKAIPNKSSHRRGQGNESQPSNNDVETTASQPVMSKLDEFGPQLEPTLHGKKARNHRRKQRKRQKKRESFIPIHDSAKADQHRAERQHTPVQCQSSAIAATPPSNTSNKSTAMMRYGPLSPDPAEWSVDF